MGRPRSRIAIGVAGLVVFSLVDCCRGDSALGWVHWTLDFRPFGMHADLTPLRLVLLQGVRAEELMALRISYRHSLAFAMGASRDGNGRATTAGEIVLAMYGRDRRGGLRVPATDFLLPVPLNAAEVRLEVRGPGSLDTQRICVCADVE